MQNNENELNSKVYIIQKLRDEHGFEIIKNMSLTLKKDKEFNIFLMNEFGANVDSLVDKDLLLDKDVVKIILERPFCNENALNILLELHPDNKEVICMLIKKLPKIYKKLSNKQKEDRDIALIVAQNGGVFVQLMPDRFKDDEDIIYLSSYSNSQPLKYASKRLKEDKSFCLRLIKDFPLAIINAHDSIKNDWDILLLLEKSFKSLEEDNYYDESSIKEEIRGMMENLKNYKEQKKINKLMSVKITDKKIKKF
jgi:hypothetical protein